MIINNHTKKERVSVLLFTAISICAFLIETYFLIVHFGSPLINCLLSIVFFLLLLFFVRYDILYFSTTTLTQTGIVYRSLLLKKYIPYQNMRFISSFDVPNQRGISVKGILFSFDWDINQYKHTFIYDGFHLKKHFCLIPYSKKAENYLKTNIFGEKYLDIMITKHYFIS